MSFFATVFSALQRRRENERLAGLDVPILNYHQVGRESRSAHPSLYISAAAFEQQIRWLSENGYQAISLGAVRSYVQRSASGLKKPIAITFDDGYEGVFRYAFPILRKYSYRATLFLVAGSLTGNKCPESFDYLRLPEIKEMAAAGMEVGCHSFNHRRLLGLSRAELDVELKDSKRILEELTGKRIEHFCYPFGAFDEAVQNAVREAGYLSACSTLFGRWQSPADVFRLKRIPVVGQQHLLQFIYRFEIASLGSEVANAVRK